MCQHTFRNWPVNPSGPGTLSEGIILIILSISSMVNGSDKASSPGTLWMISSKLKSYDGIDETPIRFLKQAWKAAAFSSWFSIVLPSSRERTVMEFLRCRSVALACIFLYFPLHILYTDMCISFSSRHFGILANREYDSLEFFWS